MPRTWRSIWPRHALELPAGVPQNPLALYSKLTGIRTAGRLFPADAGPSGWNFLSGENILHPTLNSELSLPSSAFNHWLACVFSFSGSGQFKRLLFVVVVCFWILCVEQKIAYVWCVLDIHGTQSVFSDWEKILQKMNDTADILVIPLNMQPKLAITMQLRYTTNTQQSMAFLLIFFLSRAWELLKKKKLFLKLANPSSPKLPLTYILILNIFS